jgi:hypothetical protein
MAAFGIAAQTTELFPFPTVYFGNRNFDEIGAGIGLLMKLFVSKDGQYYACGSTN